VSCGIIYKATGPGGKVYVGQTVKTLKARKGNHKYMALKGDQRTAFQCALLDEGFDAFAWEQIDQAETPEELDAKEKQWIAYYDSMNPGKGYNSTDGGTKTVYSDEARHRISKARKGIYPSRETRQKMSEARRHRPPTTEETRRRMSESMKGKNTWSKGKRLSEEHRRKLSEANKGKHHTAETRRKLSEINKGQIPWNKGKRISPK
jgi:group I intron endonuclease